MGVERILVVAERSGASFVPVRPGHPELVIGRGGNCRVRLTDPKVSRTHASLSCDETSGAVLVTDLGSRHGTIVGGRRITPSVPVPLGVDVPVRIGDTLLALEERLPEACFVHVAGDLDFTHRLDAEVERAKSEGRSFLLLVASFESGPDVEPSYDDLDTSPCAQTVFFTTLRGRAAPVAVVERAFRGRDAFFQTGEGVWRALVRDTSAAEAPRLLLKLRTLLDDEGHRPEQLRWAVFPEGGATADTLVGALADVPGKDAPTSSTSFTVFRATVLRAPPLPVIRNEIAALSAAYLARASATVHRPDPPHLSPQALALLEAYHWPGLLPERREVLERAVALCEGPSIRLEHLPVDRLCQPAPGPPPSEPIAPYLRHPRPGLPS
jgi:two-component system, NtrC family, response regulator AtoC